MRKRVLSLLLAAVMVFSISGCGNSAEITGKTSDQEKTAEVSETVEEQTQTETDTESKKEESASESEGQTENETEMVFAASRYACPGAQDAYYCSSAMGVWESLIDDGPDGPQGVLAESYTYNDDATVWTFYLRKDVVFHDGEPFNADAVLANIERTKNPLESGYTELSYERSFPDLETIEKLDDYTLEFQFSKPVPDLLISMCGYGSPMFSPKCFGEDGNFIEPAKGTGPFMLKEENPEQDVTAVRFDDYWGEKAKTQNIKLKTIKDADTRMAALKSEEVMGVVDLGAIEPAMATELVKDDRFAISTYKSSMTHLIGFNGSEFPYNDKRFREAVSLLIDRQAIVDSIFSGYGVPTTNLINHVSPYYIETPIEHDVEKAKKLAQEVLQGETIQAKLILRQKDCDRYPQEKVAVYLKSVLQEIGVEVDIQILETELYSEVMEEGTDWDLTVNKRQLPGTTLEIIESYLGGEGEASRSYHMDYSDPETDAIMEEARYEVDPERRQELFTQLQNILYDELLVVPYLHDESLVAYNKKIGGFGLDYQGTTVPSTYWVE